MHFDEQFFVAVVTVIFFAMTFKPMKKAIVGMLDSRIESIRKNLDEAESLKKQALSLLHEAEAKLARTEKEAKQMLEHAREESEQIITNTRAKLEQDVEVRKKLALQKIQSFEDKAIEDIKKNISLITVEVASKAIDEAGNDNDFKKLIAGSIDKLSKTVH